MQRGVLQLKREELIEVHKVLANYLDPNSILFTKLQYSLDGIKENNSIEISEEDLEIILDNIAPIDDSNPVLKSVFVKTSELLRQLRQ